MYQRPGGLKLTVTQDRRVGEVLGVKEDTMMTGIKSRGSQDKMEIKKFATEPQLANILEMKRHMKAGATTLKQNSNLEKKVLKMTFRHP